MLVRPLLCGRISDCVLRVDWRLVVFGQAAVERCRSLCDQRPLAAHLVLFSSSGLLTDQQVKRL